MTELTPYITALVMLLGILVGTIISPRIQHKMGIRSGRKDVLFRKKLEYFEKILETIEKNKRMYDYAIKRTESASNKKELSEVISQLKQNRKNFFILASPLYFNTEKFALSIMRFVRIEKAIFNRFSALLEKDKKDMPVLISQLKEYFKVLIKRGDEIIFEMRKELSR